MSDTLLELSRTIARHVATLRAPTERMQALLAQLQKSTDRALLQPFAAASHAYAELIARAAEHGVNGEAGTIAKALLDVREPLPWVYHYKPRSASEDLAERVAFAELIGPDGPLLAPQCRVGFTVLAENTMYPLHAHPAVELYLVIAGHAQWSTATAQRIVPPNELVLHQSNEPHAMRTFEEPLLALWAWSGDLDSPAVYV